MVESQCEQSNEVSIPQYQHILSKMGKLWIKQTPPRSITNEMNTTQHSVKYIMNIPQHKKISRKYMSGINFHLAINQWWVGYAPV